MSLSLYVLAGISKKCLSSVVPSAVTMATPTGFSSCAALKNVRLTYNTVSPMGAAHNAAAQPRVCRGTFWCRFNSLFSAALRSRFQLSSGLSQTPIQKVKPVRHRFPNVSPYTVNH